MCQFQSQKFLKKAIPPWQQPRGCLLFSLSMIMRERRRLVGWSWIVQSPIWRMGISRWFPIWMFQRYLSRRCCVGVNSKLLSSDRGPVRGCIVLFEHSNCKTRGKAWSFLCKSRKCFPFSSFVWVLFAWVQMSLPRCYVGPNFLRPIQMDFLIPGVPSLI